MPGTEMCSMVNESLANYIFNGSDDVWLKVRERILSLRIAASRKYGHL